MLVKKINRLDNKKRKEYLLSEIVFEDKANENYEKTINKINNKINEIGFENTANIYGISDTSKNGGLIGWINETQIADELRKKINSIKIGGITNPIKIPNGYLILKLNDKKEIKEKLNIEKEVLVEETK